MRMVKITSDGKPAGHNVTWEDGTDIGLRVFRVAIDLDVCDVAKATLFCYPPGGCDIKAEPEFVVLDPVRGKKYRLVEVDE